MKLSLISAFLIFLVPAAWADNNGGLQKGEAPPPPHALDSGYDGSGDKFVFQDKTGKIDVIIPQAVFDGRTVKPDQMISINGSLDKKSSPPVVRVDHLQK